MGQAAHAVMREFDAGLLYEALEAQRTERGLTWRGVADELWDLSSALNEVRDDHPISPSTLTSMQRRRATSCQHALFMLRWLDRCPEDFLRGADPAAVSAPLPAVGPDRRLRWDLSALYEALNAERQSKHLTWPQAARELRCTPNQLTGIRTAKFAIGMRLAMRIVQWLHRPAADFVYASEW